MWAASSSDFRNPRPSKLNSCQADDLLPQITPATRFTNIYKKHGKDEVDVDDIALNVNWFRPGRVSPIGSRLYNNSNIGAVTAGF